MLLSKCGVCKSKKSRYTKKKEERRLLRKLEIPLLPLLADILLQQNLKKINTELSW